jgi:flagellin-like hook-associated protein FlgL
LDTFNVDIDGNALAAAVVWRNDVTDTAADLVTAINADATLGALVTASSAAGVVTLTAATAGTGFTQGATAVADISTSGVVAATDAAGTTNGAGVTEAGDAPSMAMSRHHLYQTGAVGSGMVTAGNEDLLVKTNELSAFSVDELTTMIQNAATARAENGAQSQRLNWSSDMLAVNYTNVEAAHSRLSDVDFATESTRFAKNNILLQSAAAMLSQANSLPSVALQLLQ